MIGLLRLLLLPTVATAIVLAVIILGRLIGSTLN